jgi:hypothetical protein
MILPMMKLRTKANTIPSAKTNADSEQEDENLFVCQHSCKLDVSGSLFSYFYTIRLERFWLCCMNF